MDRQEFPVYTFVPGGPWPHPGRHRDEAKRPQRPEPIPEEDWMSSSDYRHGIRLFNAGYYWEAHEVWEQLWHAHGRSGPTAGLLKGLIQLAAAGVKVRQKQPHGVVTHGRRAAHTLSTVRIAVGSRWLGIDLARVIAQAEAIATHPPTTGLERGDPAQPVLGIQIELT